MPAPVYIFYHNRYIAFKMLDYNALNSCVFCGVLSLSADEVTCQPFFLKYLTAEPPVGYEPLIDMKTQDGTKS